MSNDNTRIYKMEFFKDFVGTINQFQQLLRNLDMGQAGEQYGDAEQQQKLYQALNKGFTIIHPNPSVNSTNDEDLGTYIYVNGIYYKTLTGVASSIEANNFWTQWSTNGAVMENSQLIRFYKNGYINEEDSKDASLHIPGSVIFDETHQSIFVDGKKYGGSSSSLIPTMEAKELYVVGGQYGDSDHMVIDLTTRQRFVPGNEHPDTKIDFTYEVLQELTDNNGLITIFDNSECNWCPAVISFAEGPDYSSWESGAKLEIAASDGNDDVIMPICYFDNTGTNRQMFSDQVQPGQTILFGLFLDGENKKYFICLNAGNAGAPGSQGIQGYEGPMGPAGEDGIQGIQGYTGADGEPGRDGIQGLQGYAGQDGTTGLQGIQGLQGPAGEATGQGSQGIQGIQGIIGLQGPAGETSSQGVDGSQGIQGLQGYTGQDGSQGIQGLQGYKGQDGSQGIQGLQGYAGQDGTNGAPGSQGANGKDGVQGADGSQGIQGLQGYKGQDGTNGASGSQGIQGIQGIIGLQGPAGEASSQGADGSQGIQGLQGIQGYTGTNGVDGTQGIQGIQGPAGEGASANQLQLIFYDYTGATDNSYTFLVQ